MASPSIVTLTDQNFEQEVLKSGTPVLVDFWAEWCGPCKMVAPILDELATEYGAKVKIAKVNIDDHQGLAGQFRITSIPTLLFFKGGQVVDQVVGLRSKKDFKTKLDQLSA
jgi:thioredoxin 1